MNEPAQEKETKLIFDQFIIWQETRNAFVKRSSV